MKRRVIGLVGLFALLVGCGDSTSESGGGDVGGGDVGGGDIGGNDGEGGGVTSQCVAPTGAPVVHSAGIEADETWAADKLHVVKGAIGVRAGATLTIDPCAIVEFETDAALMVAFPGTPTTGHLIAEGDAAHPIVFQPHEDAAWGHILVSSGATASLSHVTISGGGSLDPRGASVLVRGGNTFPTERSLFVDSVRVERSRGAGIVVEQLAGFAEGSKDLSISESGNEDSPYPLMVGENAVGTLPSGSFVGNAHDAIMIDTEWHVAEDASWRDLGVPYRVGTWNGGDLVIGAGSGEPLTTLTLEAGVRLEMFPGTAIEVEHWTGDFAASGALVASGTAAKPVVITSASAAPAAGDWEGLIYGGNPSDANRIDHARIEYTGADCGCVLSSCSAIGESEGALIFTSQPPSAFISNSVIAHAGSHAVVLGYLGAKVDFKGGFEVEDVAGCVQTLPAAPSCPSPKPACE